MEYKIVRSIVVGLSFNEPVIVTTLIERFPAIMWRESYILGDDVRFVLDQHA